MTVSPATAASVGGRLDLLLGELGFSLDGRTGAHLNPFDSPDALDDRALDYCFVPYHPLKPLLEPVHTTLVVPSGCGRTALAWCLERELGKAGAAVVGPRDTRGALPAVEKLLKHPALTDGQAGGRRVFVVVDLPSAMKERKIESVLARLLLAQANRGEGGREPAIIWKVLLPIPLPLTAGLLEETHWDQDALELLLRRRMEWAGGGRRGLASIFEEPFGYEHDVDRELCKRASSARQLLALGQKLLDAHLAAGHKGLLNAGDWAQLDTPAPVARSAVPAGIRAPAQAPRSFNLRLRVSANEGDRSTRSVRLNDDLVETDDDYENELRLTPAMLQPVLNMRPDTWSSYPPPDRIVGAELYRAFVDWEAARVELETCRRLVPPGRMAGLHLYLPRDDPYLLYLPWELCAAGDGFIGRPDEPRPVHIIRHLLNGAEARQPSLAPPRVLYVAPRPAGMDPRRSGWAQVPEKLRDPEQRRDEVWTAGTLKRRLAAVSRGLTIVHFDGDAWPGRRCPRCLKAALLPLAACPDPACAGAALEEQVDAYFVLEDGSGGAAPAAWSALAGEVPPAATLAIFLNLTPDARGAAPCGFHALAARVLAGNVCAVVGPQFPFARQDDADELARAFYEALLDGRAFADAVWAGRKPSTARGLWYAAALYLNENDDTGPVLPIDLPAFATWLRRHFNRADIEELLLQVQTWMQKAGHLPAGEPYDLDSIRGETLPDKIKELVKDLDRRNVLFVLEEEARRRRPDARRTY